MKSRTMAILGRPNVGKSTLLNALIKEKVAIVSDKPQTTRTRVLGVGHFTNAQFILIDTPGLHKPRHRLNKRMVQTALDTLHEADIVSVVVDGRVPPGPGDHWVIERVAAESRTRTDLLVFLLLNKVDLIRKSKLLPVIDAYRTLYPWTEVVPLSAKTGVNLDRLVSLMRARMPEREALYDDDFLTDQPMRQMAAEIVREKVLEQARAELPYAVAVRIEQFVEEGKLARIAASILVEREEQKAIVIGARGSRLKAIGTAARLQMEQLFGMKIFLELWVKVRASWRDDERLLIELGY